VGTYKKFGTIAALAFAVACGDSSGPGSFGPAEKTALTNALTASGALAGSPVATFAGLIISTLEEIGTMSGATSGQLTRDLESGISAALAATSYDGVGVIIDFNVATPGEEPFIGAATFVFGWNGLSTSTSNVAEFVSAGLVDLGTAVPPMGSRPIPGTSLINIATATYYERATSSQYDGVSGTINFLTIGTTGAATACVGAPANVTCTVAPGTVSGNFAFEAEKDIGSGADTYSQSLINFTLPAIRVSLTVAATP